MSNVLSRKVPSRVVSVSSAPVWFAPVCALGFISCFFLDCLFLSFFSFNVAVFPENNQFERLSFLDVAAQILDLSKYQQGVFRVAGLPSCRVLLGDVIPAQRFVRMRISLKVSLCFQMLRFKRLPISIHNQLSRKNAAMIAAQYRVTPP